MSEEMLPEVNPASRRHWMYGVNAVVMAVVALLAALIVLGCTYMIDKSYHFEMRMGSTPLSENTRFKLAELDKKPDNYTIISLYTEPPDEVRRNNPKVAGELEHHRKQVNDLLALYKRFSSHITVEDKGDASIEALQKLVRDAYKEDFEPYRKVVDDYPQIVDDLSKFLDHEAAAIGANGQKPGTPADEREAAATLQAQFASGPEQLLADQKLISRANEEVLPDWSRLTDAIKGTVQDIDALFSLLADAKKLKEAGFPATLTSYFSDNADAYKKMDAELKTYLDRINNLQPLKAQEIVSNLDRNTILVLGKSSGKLITDSELYPDFNANSGSGSETFTGEESLTDVLYAMAYPERKVKVVFVTPSPQHLLDQSFTKINAQLQKKNFDVMEWSPTTEAQQPGMPPQPGGPPPAEGKGVIWVVFTPDAPSMSMMTAPPDPRPVAAATKEHMDRGGAVLFLADAGSSFMGPASFPYADLIKDFGLEVQTNYAFVHEQISTDESGQQQTQFIPFVGLDPSEQVVLEKHDITGPLAGLPIIMGPVLMQSQDGSRQPVAPLALVHVIKPLPTGVEAQALIKTPNSPSYWGESDPLKQPHYDKGTDLDAPLTLAAVSVKNAGSKDERRVAVIGCKNLASDFFLRATKQVLIDNDIYEVPRFRGNSTLFRNTITWLAGQKVTPDTTTVAYIDMSGNKRVWMFWILLVFVPLIVLGAGAAVLAMRRS